MSDDTLRRVERESNRDPKELERLLAEYLRAGRNDDAANIARAFLEKNPADAEKRRIVAKTNPYAWTGIVSYDSHVEADRTILHIREGKENYTLALPNRQTGATIRDLAFTGKTLTVILEILDLNDDATLQGHQRIDITPKTHQTALLPQLAASIYAAHHTNNTPINYTNAQLPIPLLDRPGGIIFKYSLLIATQYPQSPTQFEGTSHTEWLYEDNQLHFYDNVNQTFRLAQSDTSSINSVRNPFSGENRHIPETSRMARNINQARNKYHLATLFHGTNRLAVEVPITILNRLRKMREEQTGAAPARAK